MLKGLDPLLGPDLLHALRAMGHGDEIAIVDANFPAQTYARRLCRADGADAAAMVRAVLSVMPLEDAQPAARRMAVIGAPNETPAITAAFEAELRRVGCDRALVVLERNAFYARAREAFAIVATGETRLYGNLILTKGALAPKAA